MNNNNRHDPGNSNETALLSSDLLSLLADMEAVAKMGTYEIELPEMKIHFSVGLFRLFGEEPHSFEPSIDYINSRSTQADSDAVLKILDRAAREKQPYYYTRRIRRKDGEWRTIESHGKPISNEDGVVVKFVGIVQDITSQKRAEQKIRDDRELLQSVFDTSLIGMAVFRAVRNQENEISDFNILAVNGVIERMTRRTDLVGKLYFQEYPPIRDTLFNLMLNVMNTGQPAKIEYQYGTADPDRWFLTMFVKNNENLVATTLDISESKKAEEEKYKNFMLLTQTEQTALIGSWNYDKSKGNLSWTEGMYSIFRLQPGTKVSPETYLQFIVPEERKKLEEKVLKKIKDELEEFDEQLTFLIEGAHRLIQIKATPITGPDGKVAQMVGIDMDITEKSNAEEKLRENEFMKMLLEKKDEFMSVASHELKTPITTLKASLQVLCRLIEKDTEKNVLLVFATKANQQINKVVRLIGDLMDNAKIQAGKINLNIDLFSLQDAIDDCLAFQHSGHEIIVRNEVQQPIEGDIHRIEQVLTNFIGNAIKYSPAGTDIIIKATQQNDEVKVEVTDFGIGIPDSKLSHVFDRFFRVDDKSQQFSGLGLGLYISSEIIKRHKGTYGVSSRIGEGSTFWFSLPLKQS